MIQLILANSKSALVPLASELEAILLYIQLENARFNHRFHDSMAVQQGIGIEYFEWPSALMDSTLFNN